MVSAQCARIHFFSLYFEWNCVYIPVFTLFRMKLCLHSSFHFISNETVFTFQFFYIPVFKNGSRLCNVRGWWYGCFSLCKCWTPSQGNSENSITVIHKSILKFYFIEFTLILMKQKLIFSNRPKFPADRLKLHAKVKTVENSKKNSNFKLKNGNKFPGMTKDSM